MDVTVPCPCPGTPHPDGDTVTLLDKPGLKMGTTVLGWAGQSASNGQPATGEIAELYVREGVVSWTFVEEDGSPKPLNDETLDWLLADYELSYPVADAASNLYTDVIFAPLRVQISNSTRTGRTGSSTSRRSRPSSSPQ